MESLFNATDDCLVSFISQNEFEESLLLNILFQDRTIVHESNFFNSTMLATHIRQARGEPSLFELAARRGLVIPAFRYLDTDSLEQAFHKMKNVYGESYGLLHPAMQPFRDRVVASVDAGRDQVKPFYWPRKDGEYLGEGYHRLIRQLLQSESPPEYTQHDPDREQLFARVWEASKLWRFDCVEEAVQRTLKKGAYGLQRLELFCAIGRRLGILDDNPAIRPKDLIDRCDGEEALAMEVFLKWVTQCHHLNQAQSFGLAINFPAYNLRQDFILDTLTRSPVDPEPTLNEGFRCKVELPPMEILLQTNASNLVAIRADLGLGYLNALKRWQDNPSSNNQEGVDRSFRDYCEQICMRYDSGIRQPFLADFGRGTTTAPVLLRDTAAAVVSGSVPGVFVQITKAINTVFRYIRGKSLTSKTSPVLRELEITLPSH